MTDALQTSPQSRKWLYIPFAIFGLIIALWSGGWFYAKSRAGEIIDRALDRQKQLGREITCPNRSISGYPFRFAVKCDKPTYKDARGLSGALEGLTAYALVYAPTRVIAEAKGPLTLTAADGEGLVVTWSSLAASASGGTRALSEASIEGKAVAVAELKSRTSHGTAEKLEIHARAVPDKPGTYALAALAEGAQVAALNGFLENADPARLEIQASADKLTQIDPRDIRVTLDAWRSAGGRVNLALFKFDKGRLAVTAKGDVGLDAERRPAGRIDTTLAGAEQLLSKFGIGGRGGAGGLLGSLLGGQRPGQPPRTVTIPMPFRFEDGRAFAGPIPIGPLKPLY